MDSLTVTPKPKKLTRVQRRLIEAAARDLQNEARKKIYYQHTALCQTCLPYSDPGDEVREWERRNGDIHLLLNAGSTIDPVQKRFVEAGLPYGPKVRQILMHLNQLALLTQQRNHALDYTLTSFVGRALNQNTGGRNIAAMDDQLRRLSSCRFTIGLIETLPDGKKTGHTVYVNIVDSLEEWFPKDPEQKLLWPSRVNLSQAYFESLMRHAIPLNEMDIQALSHSALALDIYAWLAQRLHREPVGNGTLLYWPAIAAQFSGDSGYTQLRGFRRKFLIALRQVKAVYKDARIDVSMSGITVKNSPPPVPPRTITVL